MAQANRAFLRRAVRFLVEARRSGSSSTSARASPPSATCTRSPSRSRPESRVVYVDIDPVAVGAQPADPRRQRPAPWPSRRTCAGRGRILDHPRRARADRLRRAGRPLMIVAVLHFVPDADDPAGILKTPARRARAGQLPGALAGQRRRPQRRGAAGGRDGLPAHRQPALHPQPGRGDRASSTASTLVEPGRGLGARSGGRTELPRRRCGVSASRRAVVHRRRGSARGDPPTRTRLPHPPASHRPVGVSRAGRSGACAAQPGWSSSPAPGPRRSPAPATCR